MSATPNPAASGLANWVERISQQDMPVFGQTIQKMVRLTDDAEGSLAALAKLVLQDVGMTARVLRMANSPYYNPMRYSISTISRAVVLLGINVVRSMCLSAVIVDTLIKGGVRDRVAGEIALSFHAAVQTRALAIERHDSSPETVFIAALLQNVGEMVFWCVAGETGERLDQVLRRPGMSRVQAEFEVLGFSLKDLNQGLTKTWGFDEVLYTSHEGAKAKQRTEWITLGRQVAEQAEQGWDSEDIQPLFMHIAQQLQRPVEQVKPFLHKNAGEAVQMISGYGTKAAARKIPLAEPHAEALQDTDAKEEHAAPPAAFIHPDPMLQLKILRELSSLLNTRPNINVLLEMVLEGIYRGVGLDRTLFALLTPDHRSLRPRLALGADQDQWLSQFHLEIDRQNFNLLTKTLERKDSVWVEDSRAPQYLNQLPPGFAETVKATAFFLSPIIVNQQAIGLFYADRVPSGRLLDEESYESFKLFAQQANLGLQHLTARG